jgi:hypothetical protein
VLKADGVFVSMVPYVKDGAGAPDGRLHLSEVLKQFSTAFETSSVPGFDPVTGAAARIFIGQRRG